MRPPNQTVTPEQIAQVQRLFVEYSEVIRGFILALMSDFSLADDVLQETFLTITRKAADFQPGTEFPRWACAIARYKVLEALKKSRRPEHHLSDDLIELLAEAPAATVGNSQSELLEQCLGELAPHTRQAIELRYEDDHSPATIAEKLGWTAESTYSVLSRARTFLRDCVERRAAMIDAMQS